MTAELLGIEAEFGAVDWAPSGLPTDPDEVMSWIVSENTFSWRDTLTLRGPRRLAVTW